MLIYQPRCHAVEKWRKVLLNAKAKASTAARKKTNRHARGCWC
jgi:hypothetical protein